MRQCVFSQRPRVVVFLSALAVDYFETERADWPSFSRQLLTEILTETLFVSAFLEQRPNFAYPTHEEGEILPELGIRSQDSLHRT
jgi:hypothetical protein